MKNQKSSAAADKNQKVEKISAHTVLVLVLLLILVSGSLGPRLAGAQVQSLLTPPFGGKILLKTFLVCLIPAPPPVFVIPIPFQYIMVGEPEPASLYYLYGISKQYRRYSMEVSSWSLGLYAPAADDAFRLPCVNGFMLPNADGVTLIIGTGCPEYNPYCESL